MAKLSEKQLLFGTVGITTLLVGSIGFLIWQDFGTIGEEEALVKDLQDKIAVAEDEIAKIPAREFQAIGNREIADKEVEFLPAETEIEDFWEVLERFAIESGVKISKIQATGGGRRSRRAKKGSDAITQVNQVMNLRATVAEFLRFINLIENYDRIINVVDFELSSGTADSDGKVRHNIKLSLRTFTYSKKITNTIVSIPNYDKKNEDAKVKEWISRISIEEKQTYTLTASIGRRDPFVDVRRKKLVTRDNPDSERERAQQELIFKQLLEGVRTLKSDLLIEKTLKDRLLLPQLGKHRPRVREDFRALEGQIEDVQREQVFTDRELIDQFKKQIVEEFNKIRAQIGEIDEDATKLKRAQVQEFLDKMIKHFEEHNWKELNLVHRSWRSVSRNGKKVEDEARELATRIDDIHRRSTVIQQFDKRKITISGIVYSANGVSIAVINGKLRGEGDALDADGRVIVKEIGENYVIFETEGVDVKRRQSKT